MQIAKTPVANVVTFILAEQLTATLLGVALLGERLTLPAALGAALLLLGLVTVSTGSALTQRSTSIDQPACGHR